MSSFQRGIIFVESSLLFGSSYEALPFSFITVCWCGCLSIHCPFLASFTIAGVVFSSGSRLKIYFALVEDHSYCVCSRLRSGLPHSRCRRRKTAENLLRSRAGGRWSGLALVVLVMVCWWRGWVLG
jgi:hypothetical protein